MDLDDPAGVDALVADGQLVWVLMTFGRDEALDQRHEVGLPTLTLLNLLDISAVPEGDMELNAAQLVAIAPGLTMPQGGSAFIGLSQGPNYR